MRTIKYIAIHCTATQSNQSIESIQKYWSEILKWNSPGYHWIIKAGGERNMLLPEQMVSNGVTGFNHEIINVAYIGGCPNKGINKDTRTEQQKMSMLTLLKELKVRYPNAIIQGHRDFPNVHKDCPCFDAIPEYKDI
jgi:N-acetylmuramoyl-L-alanine amidase